MPPIVSCVNVTPSGHRSSRIGAISGYYIEEKLLEQTTTVTIAGGSEVVVNAIILMMNCCSLQHGQGLLILLPAGWFSQGAALYEELALLFVTGGWICSSSNS